MAEGPPATVSIDMERLEIGLLGGFELRRDGRVLDPPTLRAARSLFAYLVLNRERAHTRDLLAGTFWPDFDESRARRRLSQALWAAQAEASVKDERAAEVDPGVTWLRFPRPDPISR